MKLFFNKESGLFYSLRYTGGGIWQRNTLDIRKSIYKQKNTFSYTTETSNNDYEISEEFLEELIEDIKKIEQYNKNGGDYGLYFDGEGFYWQWKSVKFNETHKWFVRSIPFCDSKAKPIVSWEKPDKEQLVNYATTIYLLNEIREEI